MNLSIPLTSEEQSLFDDISFDAIGSGGLPDFKSNAEKIAELTQLLLKRDAIPERRRDMFNNDSCALSGNLSVYKQFQKHGHDQQSILRHPSFVRWARYFICGPSLPKSVISDFRNKIDDLGDLTSGDSETLRHYWRDLARRFTFSRSDSDEVYKLVYELTGDQFLASTLRKEVRKVAKK